MHTVMECVISMELTALEKIVEKCSPDFKMQGRKYAEVIGQKAGTYEFHIERITGKARAIGAPHMT